MHMCIKLCISHKMILGYPYGEVFKKWPVYQNVIVIKRKAGLIQIRSGFYLMTGKM